MRVVEQIHPRLPPMQLASRNGRLYTGPCPFCADGGDDRFHVWMEASGGRPAERYWCRVCDRRGLLRTTRKHWLHVAARLRLLALRRRHVVPMPRGGQRAHERMVLVRRGRRAPPRAESWSASDEPLSETSDAAAQEPGPAMIDQARNRSLVTRLIHRGRVARRRRRAAHGRFRGGRPGVSRRRPLVPDRRANPSLTHSQHITGLEVRRRRRNA